MFGEEKPQKPRRFTPYEWETEKEVAAWLKRPQRHFFTDPPIYPLFPPAPLANFDLKFKDV